MNIKKRRGASDGRKKISIWTAGAYSYLLIEHSICKFNEEEKKVMKTEIEKNGRKEQE